MMQKTILALIAILTIVCNCDAQSAKMQIETINKIGKKGEGYPAAIREIKTLQTLDADAIPEILNGMDKSNILSANWLRSAIHSIADNSSDIPWDKINEYLADTSHSPFGRRLAYEMIIKNDPSLSPKLLSGMLEDPCLELRHDAVEHLLKSAKTVADYQKALAASRTPQQMESIIKKLDEMGTPVDLTKHMGYIMTWYMVGPFDNKDKSGFDKAYPPERKVDLEEKLKGNLGDVAWKKATSEKPKGEFDLNELMAKHKGAIAYTFTEFDSESDQSVNVRLTSKNGHKVWVNGELVLSNHVYHSGGGVDQYVGNAKLKKGKNQILIKVCQNEQTEPWAQDWAIHFRITDLTGKAIVSKESKEL